MVRPGNVHNHRVPRRAILRGKDALHGCTVESVRTEAVDRFSRQCNQPPGAQNSSRLIQRVGVMRRFEVIGIDDEPKGVHSLIVAS